MRTAIVLSLSIAAGTVASAPPAGFDLPATASATAVRAHPSDMVQLGDGLAVAGDPLPADHACPHTPRAAVADKATQRFWLCADGEPVTAARPMTTGSWVYALPTVGTYRVFAKERYGRGINGELLHRFVAFYRTVRSNRIAFHEVVNQDPATVGDPDRRGSSSGCFRLLESDSIMVWEYLQVGDPVVVTTR